MSLLKRESDILFFDVGLAGVSIGISMTIIYAILRTVWQILTKFAWI